MGDCWALVGLEGLAVLFLSTSVNGGGVDGVDGSGGSVGIMLAHQRLLPQPLELTCSQVYLMSPLLCHGIISF